MDAAKQFLVSKAKDLRTRARALAGEAESLQTEVERKHQAATSNNALADELERLAGQYVALVPVGATTTSSAGSEVQHTDGEAADEKIRYVWLPRAQCTPEQREFAVGHDSTNNPPRCAIALENLTEAQKALGLPVYEL